MRSADRLTIWGSAAGRKHVMTELDPKKKYRFDLELSSVSNDPTKAEDVLTRAADGIELANCANTFYRMVMGQQLLMIQQGRIWERMGEQVDQFKTWDYWLSEGFPDITGLSRETAYGAMQLAKSDTLSALEESQLRRFSNLANAIRLARLERQGVKVTKDLIEKAQQLPVQEFRRLSGADKQGSVELTVPSEPVATDLEHIIKLFKEADPAAIAEFRKLMDSVAAMAGGNPTDIVTALIASVEHEIQSSEERPAVYGDVEETR